MSEDSAARLQAIVRGRVQAVGFRQFVLYRARGLGLSGWVRNGDDGRTVEVTAEGPRPALETLLQRLHEGPTLSRVDSVDVTWSTANSDFRGFDVRF